MQAIYVGLFANEVLPLRPGELIRCYLLAHWNDILLSVVFCSAAIERLIDGVWMIAAFVVTAQYVPGLPEDLLDVVRLTGALTAVGLAVLAYVVLHKTHAHSMVRESRWAVTLRHIVEGLHTMGNPGTLASVVPVSFLYFLLQVFSYWALMKAFELDLSFWAAAGVLTIVRFGTVIPNAPGNVGLFQAVCFYTMHKLFGIEPNDATDFLLRLVLRPNAAVAGVRSHRHGSHRIEPGRDPRPCAQRMYASRSQTTRRSRVGFLLIFLAALAVPLRLCEKRFSYNPLRRSRPS